MKKQKGPLLTRINAIARGGNPFASTCGTTAGPGESSSVMKDESAVRTVRGFKDKAASAVMRQTFHDMREMIFNLAFRDAQQVGELIGREPGTGQEIDDPLARRTFPRQHPMHGTGCHDRKTTARWHH